ncbi:hypothetical protein STEG23_018835 [Scotinomys teguina]
MNTQAEQMYSVVQLLHLMHYYRKYDLDQDYQISATFYLVVKGLRRLASFRVCDHHYWGLAGAAASTTWRQQDLVRGGGLRSGPRGESGRVSESLQHLQLLLHHRSLPSPQLHPSLTPRGPDRHLLPLPLLPPLLPLLLTTIFLIMQVELEREPYDLHDPDDNNFDIQMGTNMSGYLGHSSGSHSSRKITYSTDKEVTISSHQKSKNEDIDENDLDVEGRLQSNDYGITILVRSNEEVWEQLSMSTNVIHAKDQTSGLTHTKQAFYL